MAPKSSSSASERGVSRDVEGAERGVEGTRRGVERPGRGVERPGRGVERPGRATRVAAWYVTGPLGHLVAGALDTAALLARVAWRRARGRPLEW